MGWGSSWSRLLHVFSLNASHLFIYYILEQDRLPISLFQLEPGGGSSPGPAGGGVEPGGMLCRAETPPPKEPPGSLRCPFR